MLSSSITEILQSLRKVKPRGVFGEFGGPMVSVHSLTSEAGAFYEKLRYLVEYKDEHTIRRSAIERMLKRKLSFEGEENVGASLLRELVSAQYLPNNTVPESAAAAVQQIADKYRLLGAKLNTARLWKRKGEKLPVSKIEITLASIAASEIDRLLFPREIDDAIAEGFYKSVKDSIRCTMPVSEELLRASTYIACRRQLLGDDAPVLLYVLVIKYLPELKNATTAEEIHALAPPFAKVLARAKREINDGLSWRIGAKIRNRAVGFALVREIIKEHGTRAEDIFENRTAFETEVKKILTEKYIKQNHSLWASGVHAAMYILLTKSILAFFLEVPYDLYLYRAVDIFALGINIVFHPIFLLALVYTIPPLDSKNMLRTLAEARGIVYGDEEKRIMHIKHSGISPFAAFIFGLLYFVLLAWIFGAIIKLLFLAHFSIVSAVLFLFFFALVSYFGLRIRYNAKRWKISPPNENAAALLWNFFTIPIVRAGRWLSQKFAAINVFIFVMDFIIEMPFKILLGTFDSFLSFLKEKEEDMY